MGKSGAIAIGLVVVAACAGQDTSVAPQPLRVAPAFDLSALTSRALYTFREEPGGFGAADATFEAHVTGASVDIAPRRADLSSAKSLVLSTSRITRGASALTIQGHAAATREGALTIARGAVTETIRPSAEGIEQSWDFAKAPAGDGDLVVRVAAKGAPFSSSTTHGLHFKSEAGRGLRYGAATWVDALGHRTAIAPRFERGEIVLTVPADVVATSRFPAVLDPTISTEQEADQPVSGSSASGDQYSPSVVSAGNGKGYFAVWYDRRGVRPALYGARISTTGTVLDDTGIPIATGVGSTTPFVAASDTGFLVTWPVSYVDLYQSPGLYAVRLDNQAHPIDTVPITLVANQTNLQLPAAAWDGAGWLVAWQAYNGTTGYDITGLHLPASGMTDGLTPIIIANAMDQEYAPVVTFDGTNHFVTWRTYTNVLGRKYDPTGKPLGAATILATSASQDLYNFGIAWNGTEYLLAWSDYGAQGLDIYGKRIAPAGTPLDFLNLGISTTVDYDDRPRVVWDGTQFVVTFTRSNQLGAARVNSAGGVLDAPPVIVGAATTSSYYYDYSLASDGSSVVAVSRSYLASASSTYDVSGLMISRPPAVAAPFVVSKAANSETEPVTAWNGTKYASAWLDTRDGRPAIYGTSLDAAGTPSPTDTKLVSDATRFPNQLTRPRIAAGGDGWLVVFYAYDQSAAKGGIWGLRLDATGQPSTDGIFPVYVPTPNMVTNAVDTPTEPDVAFDGTNFLVVWQDQASDGTTSIEGIRVPVIGTAAGDKEPLHITPSTPVDTRTVPSVAFDGQNYFVAWITSRPAAAGGIQVSHVYGSRVSKDGSVLEGEQAICNAFLLQRAPFVAGDSKNGGFMVVWEDYRTALETADVYGARISASGANLDGVSGFEIAAGDYDESRPRVAASGDGTNWVVGWRDLRSKTNYDLYGAWISIAGRSHDPNGLVLSAEAGDEDAPWLTTTKDGNLMLSYQRLDPRTNYGSYRARMRTITGGAAVAAACAKDDDCASRSCVSGVCCYTECDGCGTCNATPGQCTPRAAGSEASTCPNYKCQGTLACPATCATDADCASNATCDPTTKTCVSRVICIDDVTLKDLTGKTTSCAPYKCTADACRTQCGSVDDCASGFVCDNEQRCVQAPGADDGGCSTSGASPMNGLPLLAALALICSARFGDRHRASQDASRARGKP